MTVSDRLCREALEKDPIGSALLSERLRGPVQPVSETKSEITENFQGQSYRPFSPFRPQIQRPTTPRGNLLLQGNLKYLRNDLTPMLTRGQMKFLLASIKNSYQPHY